MKVFDFDKTIYDGDASIDFFTYCLKKNKKVLKAAPRQLSGWVRYHLKAISLNEFKERYFSFIKYINLQGMIDRFWNDNRGKIKGWYLSVKNPDDVIISSSPDFIIRPICTWLGVNSISTVFDTVHCKIIGENCKGEEKVKRFKELYPDTVPSEFYSDSDSDAPFAQFSSHSFKVKGNNISEWET